MLFKAAEKLKDIEGNVINEPMRDASGNLVDARFASDGVTVLNCKTRPQTHGMIAARSLTHKFEGDKDLNAEDMAKRYVLGAKLISTNEIELTLDEVSLIRDRVVKFGMMAAPIIIALNEAAASTKGKAK